MATQTNDEAKKMQTIKFTEARTEKQKQAIFLLDSYKQGATLKSLKEALSVYGVISKARTFKAIYVVLCAFYEDAMKDFDAAEKTEIEKLSIDLGVSQKEVVAMGISNAEQQLKKEKAEKEARISKAMIQADELRKAIRASRCASEKKELQHEKSRHCIYLMSVGVNYMGDL